VTRVTGGWCSLSTLTVKDYADGRETLADHEAEHGPLPDTVRAISGGGWSHYYFTAPPGTKISGR
jgi:hypothetical protein